ncbi:MAG TPA: TPM domain-containing protein, partial [Luteolibacter sp.]|nr:TPM domain-containing protein [Luteolibacter sp.]
MRTSRLLAWLFICVAIFSGIASGAPLPPSPEPRYVHDDAGWLGADAFSSLDLKLEWFERETSSQVVVAIFPKLPEGEELFDYSQRIFNAWMPGQKGRDNGVLM